MNINEKVCTAQIFVCSWFLWEQTCGKSNGFENRCQSKLQLQFKISVNIHSHSIKSKSTATVKILTASYSNKLVNIHDSANPTSLFPYLFAWVLQIDFSQCCVSAVDSFEIELWQVYA